MRAEEGDVDSEGVEPQCGLGQAYPELGGNANNSWRGKGLGEFARMAEFRKNRRKRGSWEISGRGWDSPRRKASGGIGQSPRDSVTDVLTEGREVGGEGDGR